MSEKECCLELLSLTHAQQLNEIEREIIDLKLRLNPKSKTFERNEIRRDLIKQQIPLYDEQRSALIKFHQEQFTMAELELSVPQSRVGLVILSREEFAEKLLEAKDKILTQKAEGQNDGV